MECEDIKKVIEATRTHIFDAANQLSEIAEHNNPESCRKAMKAMSELHEEIEDMADQLDDYLTDIDDMGADCNAWDDE
ncbi:hypothetical protein [Aliamphritea hakodatensis]|uniref:hypothetical protein n=1 Tax=Aliamphritea hakodatensis TaxID=2895352 RepID=UPI0022FD4022|nr:hypothetical protein [Aliamphritea hakodatensis]